MIENYLKTIITIAEAGSLSAASNGLFVSQPYLTKVIKFLETKYNIKIFDRHRKGVILTEQGKIFITQAKQILQNIDNLNNINNKKDNIELSISSFPSSYTMQAYIEYMSKFNNKKTFRCSYYEKNVIEIINDVYLQTCDIGLIFMKDMFIKQNTKFFHSKNIVLQKIFDTEPNVVCKPEHPILKIKRPTLQDLYKYNAIIFKSKYNVHFGQIDEGYYNEDTLSDIIDYNKFNHITYIQGRGPLHNILSSTNSIAIGNHITTDNHKIFNLCCIPLRKYAPYINIELFNNTLFCIHLKDKPLSQYAKLYLEILKKYNHSKTVSTPPPHLEHLIKIYNKKVKN